MTKGSYTEKEIKLIIELYPDMTIRDIAKTLKRNYHNVVAIVYRMRKLGFDLPIKKEFDFWTPEKEKKLISIWDDKTLEEIAEELGKPKYYICAKARKMRISGIDLPRKRKINVTEVMLKRILADKTNLFLNKKEGD